MCKFPECIAQYLTYLKGQVSLEKVSSYIVALAWSPAPQSSSSLSFQTPPEMSGLCSSSATIRDKVLWSNPAFTISQSDKLQSHAPIYIAYLPNIILTSGRLICPSY